MPASRQPKRNFTRKASLLSRPPKGEPSTRATRSTAQPTSAISVAQLPGRLPKGKRGPPAVCSTAPPMMLPLPVSQSRRLSRSILWNIFMYSLEDSFNDLHPRFGPLKLLHIDVTFRDFAESMPSLWSTITIFPAQIIDTNVPVLRRWLVRSGTGPLNVCVGIQSQHPRSPPRRAHTRSPSMAASRSIHSPRPPPHDVEQRQCTFASAQWPNGYHGIWAHLHHRPSRGIRPRCLFVRLHSSDGPPTRGFS